MPPSRSPLCLIPLLLALAAPAAAQTGPSSTHKPVEQAVGRSSPPITPPDPLAPPGLEGVVGGPVHEARQRLADAEVFDALGIRAHRQAELLVAGLPFEQSCLATLAALRTASLSVEEGAARVRTARALLDGVGGDDDLARLESVARRLDDLQARGVSGARLAARAGCKAEGAPAPRVFLPAEDREPVAGRVVVAVELPVGRRVLWAQGAPVAVARVDGWSLALVPAGLVKLCSARPEDTDCDATVEVEAVMGGAFVLPTS